MEDVEGRKETRLLILYSQGWEGASHEPSAVVPAFKINCHTMLDALQCWDAPFQIVAADIEGWVAHGTVDMCKLDLSFL